MGKWKPTNHCEISQEAIEWINGELLGDSSLHSQSKYSAKFQYSLKYLEYIQYISKTLSSFGIKQGGRINRYCSRFNSNNYVYHYQSLRYAELLPIYKKWYPKRKKIIPKDLKLTPLVCRQWYIGDGSLNNKEERSRIRLYTNGFIILDVKWLVKQLINLGFRTTRQPTCNIICVSSHSTKKFLDYIGFCPVECYKYKWDYKDNRKKKCMEVAN